jgi:hypothetical protein
VALRVCSWLAGTGGLPARMRRTFHKENREPYQVGSELQKVLAFSANDIFAVGDSNTDHTHTKPLIDPTPLPK